MSAQKELLGAVGAGIGAAGAFGSIGQKLTKEQKGAKEMRKAKGAMSNEAAARKKAIVALADKKDSKKRTKYNVKQVRAALHDRELKKKIALAQSDKKMKREAK